ncbi:ZN414 protein, partial [Eudromia elegans]|nr:ZN414 protein [Eudromia elegans]
ARGPRGRRPPPLDGGHAAAPAGRPPLPTAGAQPVRAVVPGAALGASPLLGAGALRVLRAPLVLQLTSALGPAPPPALRARPGPPRLQRHVEEEPSRGVALPPVPMPVLAGHSSAGRIVWEHTRGRYSCTQCPFGTASRDDMTLHTEEHRKPPARLQGDAEFGVGIGPFHPKLPPEMEPSLYSQL